MGELSLVSIMNFIMQIRQEIRLGCAKSVSVNVRMFCLAITSQCFSSLEAKLLFLVPHVLFIAIEHHLLLITWIITFYH